MLLSEQMNLIREHQEKAPVKVVALAHALGLKVYLSKSLEDNVSGMIKKDKNKGGASGFAIYVNANHPETRRRFTVAHEIAHFILHRGLIGDGIAEDALLRSGLSNSVERQANGLAADILMPWDLLEKEASAVPTIEGLAARFEVSRDAMSYRILGLSYDDAQLKGHA